MKRQWALQIERGHGSTAAVLRAHAGVEVCETPEALWLRGPCDGGAIERAMWLVPGVRYRITFEGQLIPWKHLLPVAALPQGDWMPLAKYLQPSVAAPALPGELSERVTLQWVRTGREQPAALLLLDAATWAEYVHDAPAIRLARLQFALSSEGAILVRGTPLPALPGTPFTLDAGIASPCGYTCVPAVKAEHIAESLQLKKDDIALFAPDGTCQIVPAGAWIPVTRSAVRISLQGMPA